MTALIDTKTFNRRKSRSPSIGRRASSSRSPSRDNSNRLLSRARRENGFDSAVDAVNNGNGAAYAEYAERTAYERNITKEREDEKRRLQVRMNEIINI